MSDRDRLVVRVIDALPIGCAVFLVALAGLVLIGVARLVFS